MTLRVRKCPPPTQKQHERNEPITKIPSFPHFLNKQGNEHKTVFYLPTLIWRRAKQSDSKRLTLCFLPIFLILFVVLIQKTSTYEQSFRRNFQAAGEHRKDDCPGHGRTTRRTAGQSFNSQ